MTELSPLLQSAFDALSKMPQKQGHIDDIIESIRQIQGIPGALTNEDFKKKLGAAMLAATKKKGAMFARVVGKKASNGKPASYKLGMYRLRQIRSEPTKFVEEITATNPAFLGKAGEYAVMGELLFYDFNVSLMSVDQGIDIVASKNGRYYHLQVKTSSQRSDGSFYFSIKKSSFEDNHSGTTFYVLVMRHSNKNIFAVFPSHYLDSLRKVGGITDGEKTISISIKPDEKFKTFSMNGKNTIDHFIGAFGQIK